MGDGMTKTERTELRSVVRNQFRVLRHEVAQRHAELLAGIDRRVADRFAAQDKVKHEIEVELHRIAGEANEQVVKLVMDKTDLDDPLYIKRFVGFDVPRIMWSPRERTEFRQVLTDELRVTVEGAKLALDRQEADLLRTLAAGALETDGATAFLSGIPTVGELVPAERLAALERGFQPSAIPPTDR